MSRRKNTSKSQSCLTEDETKTAAARLMAGAQAHQRASVWCKDKPDAKPPNIDWFFFNVVSMELILISVEQSLRLLLLLHYGIIRDDTNHAPHVLYKAVRNKSDGRGGIRRDIVDRANDLGSTRGVRDISESEIVSCLKRHDSSYTNFRYFQLNHQGHLNPDFGFTTRDLQVLHCLSLGLIHLNMAEMERRKIGVIGSMSKVPESRMTDDLRALKQRLTS